MPKLKEVLVQLLEPFKISMMIFTPALLLVLGGFHFMSPTVLSQLIDLRKEEVNEAVVKEVTARIDAVVDKKLTGENIGRTTATGALTKADKEVINKSIQKQVEEETKKATKDELENLAKTLKADLYKDISLSVIFAIASIFAAFAVKDVLTEILKREEKIALQNDVVKTLKERIGIIEEGNASDNSKPETLWSIVNSKVTKHIDDLEKSNNKSIKELEERFSKKLVWLEYEIASLALYTEDSKIQEKDLTKHMCRINRTLERLVEVGAGDKDQIKILKDYNDIYFVSITDAMPNLGDCHETYDRVGIVLARAKLTLDSIKKDGLPPEVAVIFKSLTNEINSRRTILKTQREGLSQGSIANAPIRFPKG